MMKVKLRLWLIIFEHLCVIAQSAIYALFDEKEKNSILKIDYVTRTFEKTHDENKLAREI